MAALNPMSFTSTPNIHAVFCMTLLRSYLQVFIAQDLTDRRLQYLLDDRPTSQQAPH